MKLPYSVTGALLLLSSTTLLGSTDEPYLKGDYVSADRCFRLVAYAKPYGTGILFYGCLTTDSAQYHYVTEARNVRRNGHVFDFELPPRQFSRLKSTTAGIAGHQSELPPRQITDVPTMWRLSVIPPNLLLECVSSDTAVCGIHHTVELMPSP